MVDVLLILAVLSALAAGWWLLRDLRTVPRGPDGGHPAAAVSVVIPARDEEASLPALLDSLHRLTLAPRQIIVVDDGSGDATASIARAAGALVLPAGPPPPGWTGKAWACQIGARAATGDLLLFLDADTRLAPDALVALLSVHSQQGGLVSVQPYHLVHRPYEQLSMYFNVVSLLASGAFTGRPSRRAMAFGPCLLTSRVDYDRAGGHAAVRSEILDDVALAVAYQRAGMPIRCLMGGRSIRMRSYPGGPGQMAAGWSKNIASGASAAAPEALLPTLLWVCVHHAVAVAAVVTLAQELTGLHVGAAPQPAVCGIGWLAIALQLCILLRRVGSFRWWSWAVFPLPLLAFDAIFAVSAAHTLVRRSVRWRGREVSVASGGPLEREV